MNYSYKIIFVKTIACILITLAFLLIVELFWLASYKKGRKKGLSGKLISTFIIVIETLNSGLLVQIANSVICEKINEEYYLSKDLSIICSDDAYLKWVKKIIIIN